ncbi:hypothetical protein GCM10009841_35510 [Microlunatus panaciterrae]|uniref:Uncharacterized protein n=1 Tax=Microlunatus panaciterrae TaxID=400768 RepID=A0ABS2RGS0_9ACTN|nr:hypothetical protein [Microlunatus panaciterrae]MBM7798209.1 hypothetical protein [Microlunatus panaciterrae]
MATWEDGPEYAPLERPEGFHHPDVPPLEVAPPPRQLAAGAPMERPQFAGPPGPVVPLAALVPADPEQHRDPQTPFETVVSTVTAGPIGIGAGSAQSAWGSAHWSPPSGQPVGPWGPPATTPWPAPASPTSAAPVPVGGAPFPAPGTPQWFGPGAPPPQLPSAGPVDAKKVWDTVTPAVAICLLVGGLIYVFSPIMLVLAAVLASRITVGRPRISKAFYVVFGVLGFFALVGIFTHNLSFGDWYGYLGRWALALCWALLVVLPVIVSTELKKHARSGQYPPPYNSTWG